MRTSPDILSLDEHCHRAGAWGRDWERYKLTQTDMLMRGIREGLITQRTDFNDAAGEAIIEASADPGLDSKEYNIYDACIHLASISDIVTTAIRKPQDQPWEPVKPVRIGDGPIWRSDAFLDPSGTHLRSVALVSGWSDDRHFGLCRSWDVLGNVCAYDLPMQVAVIILGQYRAGKRHGFWSHGLLHPISKKVRFRKKTDRATPFKESWLDVWRENRDEITTKAWLDAMHSDGVLADVCFRIDMPVQEKAARQKILDLADRRLTAIEEQRAIPDQQLSNCFWPERCQFVRPCHNGDQPNGKYGFVPVEAIRTPE